MRNEIEQKSVKELREAYKSIKVPDWLLQDTLQKTEQQRNKSSFSWMPALSVGVVALVLAVILIPKESIVTTPTIRSPSLVDLDISKVKPERFYMPSATVIGRVPTIPKTPVMPKRKHQTSQNTKQHSLFITNSYFYKETNKHV